MLIDGISQTTQNASQISLAGHFILFLRRTTFRPSSSYKKNGRKDHKTKTNTPRLLLIALELELTKVGQETPNRKDGKKMDLTQDYMKSGVPSS